ncbi:MAG: 50S ribosomal protein L25/general stress protein Ctc [Microbacteriaceae bacterium]|jgi:large subunit ribosomal protein L25|nr:50S ribosomal protein L25/general stress protein Ctc [Microbacteriaceae bacterium]
MADIITIPATVRTTFGKGAARRLRRDGHIPAVIYGHGQEPIHVALPEHETTLATRTANALLSLDVEGTEPKLVLVKDIQKDPVKMSIEHLDLMNVTRSEKVEVEVPISLTGVTVGNTVAELSLQTITVSAPVVELPDRIEVSVDGAAEGTRFHAKDLDLGEDVELVTDPEALVVAVIIPSAKDMGDRADEVAEEQAEAAAAADAAAAGTEAGATAAE